MLLVSPVLGWVFHVTTEVLFGKMEFEEEATSGAPFTMDVYLTAAREAQSNPGLGRKGKLLHARGFAQEQSKQTKSLQSRSSQNSKCFAPVYPLTASERMRGIPFTNPAVSFFFGKNGMIFHILVDMPNIQDFKLHILEGVVVLITWHEAGPPCTPCPMGNKATHVIVPLTCVLSFYFAANDTGAC